MLKKLATLGVLLVAGLHIVFMVIELTFWDTDFGRRLTHLSPTVTRDGEHWVEPGTLQRLSWIRLVLGDVCSQGTGSLLCSAGFSYVHCWDGCRRSNLD